MHLHWFDVVKFTILLFFLGLLLFAPLCDIELGSNDAIAGIIKNFVSLNAEICNCNLIEYYLKLAY